MTTSSPPARPTRRALLPRALSADRRPCHPYPSTLPLSARGPPWQVRSFIELAFECIGVTLAWTGKGVEEVGYDKDTNKELVKIDPKYFRARARSRGHATPAPTPHRPVARRACTCSRERVACAQARRRWSC